MNAPFIPLAANQAALATAVAWVRVRLERQAAGAAQIKRPTDCGGSTLDAVTRVFGLSDFERDVLVLAAGPELDAGFPAPVTLGMALAALPDAHWSALGAASPLRAWRLIQLADASSLTRSPIVLDEPILHLLAGAPQGDPQLATAQAWSATTPLPPSQAEWAAGLAARWAALSDGAAVIQLSGPPAAGVTDVAGHAALGLGRVLHRVSARALVEGGEPWWRRWSRQALLFGHALLVDVDGPPPAGLEAAIAEIGFPLLLAAVGPLEVSGLTLIKEAVPKPGADEQAALWRVGLGEAPGAAAAAERAVAHFDLAPVAIAAAATAARGSGLAITEAAWASARALARRSVAGVEQREPIAGWADLALPFAAERTLHDIAAQVRGRRQVHDHWGFARTLRGALGLAVLFHGPSGTGKSLAAEVLAHDLGLALWTVDLSGLVSKYIGETQKNLARVFDAAEGGGAVLLFDEADALFGRRSEVRDSHDRYANQDVSYLLQRIETSTGLCVLTTNSKESIDSAFLRRFRFQLDFAHPHAAERRRIWERVLPAEAPRAGVDPARLAQLNLAGGAIRNIALSAAFLAADEGPPITMTHLRRAAEHECAKLGRPLTAAETEGWI